MKKRINGGIEKYASQRNKSLILAGQTPEWIVNHKYSKTIIQYTLASPPWIRARDFKELRRKAFEMTQLLGKLHTIGHIIPVKHDMVCGLNVPWNCQVEPAKCNFSKGNRWHPDQLTLDIDEPMQLALIDG